MFNKRLYSSLDCMVDVKCETDSDGTKVFHHLAFVKIVPSDIPWHVYAKLTSLSGWHQCWVTAFRGAGGECRLRVKRLINASLGFHWHFTGCRRWLPLLIWLCPSFVFIFHCPSISLNFIAPISILKHFIHANILSVLLAFTRQTWAIFYHGYLSQYLLNRLESLPVPVRGPGCC